jgi:hypothetical protein
VREWLDGAAAPLARVLDKLGADERAAFIKAMDMLEAEFRAIEGRLGPYPGVARVAGRESETAGQEAGGGGLPRPGGDAPPRPATPPANPG